MPQSSPQRIQDSTAARLRRIVARPPDQASGPRACTRAWSATAAWSGRRASEPPTSTRPRRATRARRPVPDRLQHQDVHRRDGHAAARRGQAHPRRHARHASSRRSGTPGSRSGSACARLRACSASRSATSGRPWTTPTAPQLVSGFNEAERVHRPHHLLHYSNLVFSMLGEVVARLDGREWHETLQARMLDPLEMRRTTVGFSGRHVQRLLRPAVHRRARPAAGLDLSAMAPCGGLASTARGPGAVVGVRRRPGRPRCSHPDTLEEMCEPQIMMDRERWTGGAWASASSWSAPAPARTSATPAACPGTSPRLFTDREAGTGGVVLINSRVHARHRRVRDRARRPVTEHEPGRARAVAAGHRRPAGAGRPGRASGTPRAARSCSRCGRGGWRRGPRACPEHKPSSRVRAGRAATSPHRRRPRGTASCCGSPATPTDASTKMNWATYLVTREPLAFGERP